MEIPLLADFIIILVVSIVVLYLFHLAKLPAIVGFLLTGVLAGPHGFALISGTEEVEVLAEIGIVLLLFTIGLELSFQSLIQIKRSVLIGGTLQVVLTTAATAGIMMAIGRPIEQAIFIGFLVALSSTAIVMKSIQERAEMDSPQGKNTLGILIFQDLAIVPMLLLTPVLAGSGGSGDTGSLWLLLGKGVLIVILVLVAARWLVPALMLQITKTRSRELFLFSVVGIGLVIAWLTSSIGLSLALGAFLAGLVISESGYSHQALGNVLPLRDLFTSLFFVSVGMLLDLGTIVDQPLLVIGLILGVLFLKSTIAFAVTLILRYPLRTSVLVGLGLSQVGEFSFILSGSGQEFGLLSDNAYQLFLAVSVMTMAATPFIISSAPRIADRVSGIKSLKWLERNVTGPKIETDKIGGHDHLSDHLVIIGYGLNGKHLVKAAKAASIPYVVVDANPELVRIAEDENKPFHWGDATEEAVLEHIGVTRARVVAIGISDPTATRKCTEVVRSLSSDVYIVARTHYFQELAPLIELGADEVIPEEFETSIEIFTRVLGKYLIPSKEIESFISEVREGGYEMFRSPAWRTSALSDLKVHMPELEVITARVTEESPVVGLSIAASRIKEDHGFTLLLVKRGKETTPHPESDMVLEVDDIVCGMIPSDALAALDKLFPSGKGADQDVMT